MNRAALLLFVAPLAVLGCKDKTPAVVDSGATVATVASIPAPPPTDTAPEEIKPLDEMDAGFDSGIKKPVVLNPVSPASLQAQAKACCNALRQGAGIGTALLGNSPEAQQFKALAGQCDAYAATLGKSTGTPTELAPLRTLLAGKPVPQVCKF